METQQAHGSTARTAHGNDSGLVQTNVFAFPPNPSSSMKFSVDGGAPCGIAFASETLQCVNKTEQQCGSDPCFYSTCGAFPPVVFVHERPFWQIVAASEVYRHGVACFLIQIKRRSSKSADVLCFCVFALAVKLQGGVQVAV